MDRTTFGRVVDAVPEGLRSLAVSGPHGEFVHHVTGDGSPADVRSISKLVVSLAVGAAIADGVRLRGRPLSLDLPIWPYFADRPDRQSPTGRANLRAVRLRHLLTNTTGHSEGFLFRADLHGLDRDMLLDHVLAREVAHPPGTHFAYSNAGWYLISALVTEVLGVRLRDWVGDLVLRRLGIADVGWASYGRYDAGGTGLALSAPDLLAVGKLFLDGGRDVVPRAWIEALRSPTVRVDRTDGPDGRLRATHYGYGMWIGDGGVHYCDGTGGQFLIVDPGSRTVVVALAEAGDTRTVARYLEALLA